MKNLPSQILGAVFCTVLGLLLCCPGGMTHLFSVSLLLCHWCNNLLHVRDDVFQLVWVGLCNLLNGVAHRGLRTGKKTKTENRYSTVEPLVQRKNGER